MTGSANSLPSITTSWDDHLLFPVFWMEFEVQLLDQKNVDAYKDHLGKEWKPGTSPEERRAFFRGYADWVEKTHFGTPSEYAHRLRGTK